MINKEPCLNAVTGLVNAADPAQQPRIGVVSDDRHPDSKDKQEPLHGRLHGEDAE